MVDFHFAQSVRDLAREDLNVAQIAERLQSNVATVVAALHMLGLPLPGERDAARAEPRRIATDSAPYINGAKSKIRDAISAMRSALNYTDDSGSGTSYIDSAIETLESAERELDRSISLLPRYGARKPASP